MLTGGLLPFPRTGCVLYAKAILSYCSEIRQVRPPEGMGRLRRVAHGSDTVLLGRTWRTIAVARRRLSTSIDRLHTMDDTPVAERPVGPDTTRTLAAVEKHRLDIAIAARQFEIDLLWRRSQVFGAFTVVAFTGVGIAIDKSHPRLAAAIICFGLVSSFAWTLANRGSR